MRNFILKSISGLILVAAVGLPAVAEGSTASAAEGGKYILTQMETMSGTYQGMHMGQVLMTTDSGQNFELPSMSLFWSNPQVHLSTLTVGQALKVTLPRGTGMRVIGEPEPEILGDYNGVYHLSNSTITSWRTETIEAAAR